METIYIEDIFLIEFLTNALLFFCITALFRKKTAKIRLILTALVGAMFSMFYPENVYALFAYKTLALFVLSFTIFNHKSIKEYVKTAFSIIVMTNITAVITYNLIKLPFFVEIGENLAYIFVLAVLLILAVIVRKIVKKLISTKTKCNYVYDLSLESEGKTSVAKGYFDSGNRLIAPGGEPIIVIDKAMLDITNCKLSGEQIVITTAAGKKIKSLYDIEKMTITVCDKKRQFSHIKAIASAEKLCGYDVILNCDTCIQ